MGYVGSRGSDPKVSLEWSCWAGGTHIFFCFCAKNKTPNGLFRRYQGSLGFGPMAPWNGVAPTAPHSGRDIGWRSGFTPSGVLVFLRLGAVWTLVRYVRGHVEGCTKSC